MSLRGLSEQASALLPCLPKQMIVAETVLEYIFYCDHVIIVDLLESAGGDKESQKDALFHYMLCAGSNGTQHVVTTGWLPQGSWLS